MPDFTLDLTKYRDKTSRVVGPAHQMHEVGTSTPTHVGPGLLCCPVCSQTFTHIDEVIVSGRLGEDGGTVARHVAANGDTNVLHEVPGEFTSDRRHAVTLKGWCESCSASWALVFAQHEGMTLVRVLTNAWIPAGWAKDGTP